MNIFLKVFLCLFYFVIQTSLTNLTAMNLKKLKTKITVHIFFLKKHPTFYAKERLVSFVVLSTLLPQKNILSLGESTTVFYYPENLILKIWFYVLRCRGP